MMDVLLKIIDRIMASYVVDLLPRQLGFWLELGSQRLLGGKQQLSNHTIALIRSPCGRAQEVRKQRVGPIT